MLRLGRKFSWTVRRTASHPDFKISSAIYEHDRLKSRLIHLSCPDPHKSAAILFRTIPSDSTGAPHCLEHIVLCGSDKYPVRDPFMKMLTRSLNSYMNAWTGSDFTMYPFSTQNHKDFSNLLNVYMDSVFFPLITEHDFRQEAWRLEYTGNKLEYKGVVYNEMKGVMSDPNNYLIYKLNEHTLQGTSYAYNSGGDPEHIPNMTHAQLVEFHKKFYHPSNATFLFYGDMDIQQTMNQLEENALKQ